MPYIKNTHTFRPQNRSVAIFVDYNNLYEVLSKRQKGSGHTDEYIADLFSEIKRFLHEEYRAHPVSIKVFADFDALSGNGSFIQSNLVRGGYEVKLVSTTLQKNAGELSLSIDAATLLQTRSDVDHLMILSGNRPFLPLLQAIASRGCTAILAAIEVPKFGERPPFIGQVDLLSAFDLMGESTRKDILGDEDFEAHEQRNGTSQASNRSQVTYHEVTATTSRYTLEIIEEHFGQYEEVYLTPLLRKLSELVEDEAKDPKGIINDLEDAGAVWLEKRRGFPYDYTVLLVDPNHPTVQSIHDDFISRTEESDTPADIDEEPFFNDYDNVDENGFFDEDVTYTEEGGSKRQVSSHP